MIDPLREIDYIPPNIFGIYKHYEEDIYALWPHNLRLLYDNKNIHTLNCVAYIPFIYRNKKVILKN